MTEYYDGGKLISLRDIDRQAPEIHMVVGNRSAGKSYWLKRYLMRRYMRHGEMFGVLVRPVEDVANTAEGFWADIGPLEWPGKTMTQKPIMHGKAAILLLDKQPCGYVLPLNAPDAIKRNSALFASVQRLFFDEFLREDGRYLPRELEKFNSLRISVARGGATGALTRHVPVLMAANAVDPLNPYWDYLGVLGRLQERTKFLRGKGWVLEMTYNAEAAELVRQNNRTMSDAELAYVTGGAWLRDQSRYVSDIPGTKYCILGLRHNGRLFGVWQCANGKLLVRKQCDPSVRNIITTSDGDHISGTLLVGQSAYIVKILRDAYGRGLVYFGSGQCRYAFVESMRIV